MRVFKGQGVCGGIAIGTIRIYKKAESQVKCVKINDACAELERFRKAKKISVSQLKELYQKALEEVGEENAAIFEAHRMMLEDENYIKAVEQMICMQMVNAEYAVTAAGEEFARMFSALNDEYMRERSADVKDVSSRLVGILSDVHTDEYANNHANDHIDSDTDVKEIRDPVIIVAEDLTPSETVQMEKSSILSFVTVHGSATSHTAILAGTMGIPAIVGTDIVLDDMPDGAIGIVDGADGLIYVEPDEETLTLMQEKQRKEWKEKELLKALKGREDITLDGQKVLLYANIANIRDLKTVFRNDAAGIGLFRSEFIYLEKATLPTEEEQFQIYKTVAEKMAGKEVIIRTLDIGADKQCAYLGMEQEENPALGYRAIRICLTQPDIFKTQLRALFRAAVYGNIAIMYPMIISVGEVRRIREIVEEVKAELSAQGIAYGNPKQGIMIETPAAVLMSEELAKEVDFFSIGTNDLTQYTLAIDRQNPKLDAFYDAHHPAVLKMISMVVENAHKAGIPVGICGELAADTTLTGDFLAMGVDELSVSPGNILPIRKIIIETNVGEYKKMKDLLS